MRIIKTNNPKVIEIAVKYLSEGKLIIYPTETCYGAGVDATNQKAVNILLKYKDRREGNPISIAVAHKEMAQKYAEINETADNLYQNYLPGPITVVSNYKGNLAKGLASEYKTIGIRIPDYDLILKIIEKYAKPITSTSAQVAYKQNPYSIPQLLKDLPEKNKKKIGLIIDEQ